MSKYTASIADKRLPHCSFEFHGYHHVSADTIDDLIEKIRALGVERYSENVFLDRLRKADSKNTRDDCRVELYWDGTRTHVDRGEYNINNMTEYTSF